MFKKPLGSLKTSAPLRSSDRRKLKQRVFQLFPGIPPEDELLVPDGLLSVKFSTHLEEPGIAYLAPNGDPLWFTIGKGSDDLIPTGAYYTYWTTSTFPMVPPASDKADVIWTWNSYVRRGSWHLGDISGPVRSAGIAVDVHHIVYTLWKRPNLLPFLSTPAAVISVLVGGADLMIPGVVKHAPSLRPDQLVSITQHHAGPGTKVGPPLAVGRMALPSDEIREDGKKGKAVFVLHTWKDCLWELGSGGDVPEATEIPGAGEKDEDSEERDGQEVDGVSPSNAPHETITPVADETPPENSNASALSPQEVTLLLRTSLLQSISTILSKLPPSSFPITATIFYATYLLPCRPSSSGLNAPTTPIDIKNSSHKSLTTFLKSAEKEGLLKLKDQKSTAKSKATDLVITGVFPQHADVLAHQRYTTLKDVEDKRARQEEKEEGERKKVKEMEIRECWKPWQGSVGFFESAGASTSSLYTLPEIKTLLSDYTNSHNLVNPNDQSYINIDALLSSTLSSKTSTEPLEFLKRDELARRLVDKMQAWYGVSVEGKEPMVKKGSLKPISVIVKIRQGRKASTLITNFEPYLLTSDFLAEELRRICASATSVSPVQGKTSGMEVLVQGKQIQAVTELLVSKGVPKKWIESSDLSGKKK